MPEKVAKAGDSFGVWRVAFAFDPKREAILPVAGDKSGGNETRSYGSLAKQGDARFNTHLATLKARRQRK